MTVSVHHTSNTVYNHSEIKTSIFGFFQITSGDKMSHGNTAVMSTMFFRVQCKARNPTK